MKFDVFWKFIFVILLIYKLSSLMNNMMRLVIDNVVRKILVECCVIDLWCNIKKDIILFMRLISIKNGGMYCWRKWWIWNFL